MFVLLLSFGAVFCVDLIFYFFFGSILTLLNPTIYYLYFISALNAL